MQLQSTATHGPQCGRVGAWDMGQHGTLGWTHLTPHMVAHIANECWDGGSGRDTLHTSGKFPSLGNYSPSPL